MSDQERPDEFDELPEEEREQPFDYQDSEPQDEEEYSFDDSDSPGTAEVFVDDVIEEVEIEGAVDPYTEDGGEFSEESPLSAEAAYDGFDAGEPKSDDEMALSSDDYGDEYGAPRSLDDSFDGGDERVGAKEEEYPEDAHTDSSQDPGAEEEAEHRGPSFEPLRVTPRETKTVLPLPSPGPFESPALITVYKEKEVLGQFELLDEKTLFGANAPPEEGVFDLASAGVEGIAAVHLALFRQNKNYTLCVLSDEETQLNGELLTLGDRRKLHDGDVIIAGQELGLRLSLPL